MRGRLGLTLMLAAALLIAGGCRHMTPEEKRQKQLDKQAAAAAKAEQKRANADAKAQAAAQKKQVELERKQAAAQAKAQKKQMAVEQKRQDALVKQQAKQAEAQAKADKEAADAKATEDKRQAALAAKEQKKQAQAERKQAAMMAKADKRTPREEKPAAAMAMDDKKHKAASDYYPDDQLKVIGYPHIKPENNQRLLDRMVEMMSASGEYQEATLSDTDFDGAELNATGRANLALALQYPKADNKLTIYVNTSGGEDVTSARAAAVERYWKASQWSGVQLATKAGPNPNVTAPAGAGIAALKRMEKPQQGGSATATGSDTTGGRSRMSGETRQGE